MSDPLNFCSAMVWSLTPREKVILLAAILAITVIFPKPIRCNGALNGKKGRRRNIGFP